MSCPDPVLEFMLEKRIPITKETYLEIAFMSEVPELDEEEVAEVPDLIGSVNAAPGCSLW
jgi:hypothetical protein